MSLKLAVLASGSGTNFQAMVDAVRRGALDADIRLVICNRPGAKVIERAKAAGIICAVMDHKLWPSREAYDLAVADAIRGLTGLEAAIKWPNDIVCGGKKVVGILTEMSTEAEWIRYVIVGIGINVNMDGFPGELGKTATSLKLELGRGVKRSPLVAAVMNAFEKYYALFEKAGDLSGLVDTYNRWSANTGRQVRVLDPAGEYQGEALGIDSQGALLVKCSEGEVKSVISGEVSVRGVYGYV